MVDWSWIVSSCKIFKKTLLHQPRKKKLNESSTSNKMYWTIMKTFINGKKPPIIPPLLVNNNLISNLRENANTFNDFFVQQCQPIASNSILPQKSNILYTE